ncbi:MAG TPA: reverse transcriptase-like protein [Propionicimonas sp.]|nr:reverse transcriptase-like protein [Propionicimonas sp.]
MARAPIKPQVRPGLFDLDDPLAEPAEAIEPDDALGQRSARRLVIEADGGSRGNPGPAAYGALVRDAETGEVLNCEGLGLGTATNNVAEYSALIAGLEMAKALDPNATVEVRMDSKLVIEQMAGRWKVKHPDMVPLASKAQQLRPVRTIWTWVPRELNSAADALVNAALNGQPRRRS